jgi:hypothetical protein
MASAVLHLRSLGQLTSDLQRPYAALARAVDRLAVRPKVTIDGVPYFDGAAVAAITAEATRQDPAQPAHVAPRRVPRRDPAKDATATTAAPRGERRHRARRQSNPNVVLSR